MKIVISGGYGGGWVYRLKSDNVTPEELMWAMTDPGLVNLVEGEQDYRLIAQYVRSHLGQRIGDLMDVYTVKARVVEVPDGKKFCIREQGGKEWVVLYEDIEWYTFNPDS